jgi:uncharacterized membrane protein
MIDSAQIHLALNHFPVAGMFFTAFLLAIGLIFKKRELILSGMLIAVISALAIIPMSLSGDGVEEIVEHKPGVTHELIHEHEEMGEKALIIFMVTGVLAISWFALRKSRPNWERKIEVVTFLLSIISALVIAQAAHLGGMIRHDELRSEKSQ